MRVSLKWFHRPSIAVSAIVFVLVLIIRATISALPTVGATTLVQQCMRNVTVTSKPCGATIYIDGIEVGRTPMKFPMPTGGYTLVLRAPGHHPYAKRILVPDAPLEVEANLVPLK